MLLEKIKAQIKKLVDEGKTKEEIDEKIKTFIGDERVEDEDGNEVEFELSIKEAPKKVSIEIEKEVKAEVEKVYAEEKVEQKRIFKPEPKETIPAEAKTHGPITAFEGPDKELKAYQFGMFMKAVAQAKNPYLGTNALDYCKRVGMKITQVEGTNASGGFVVPQEYSSRILELVSKWGAFRRNANVINMTRLVMNVPTASQIVVGFVTEGADKTERNKTFARTTLTAKKAAAITPFSDELLDDAPQNLANFFMENMSRAIAYREDYCGFVADGGTALLDGGCVGLIPTMEAVAGNDGLYDSSSGALNSITIQELTNFISIAPQYAYTPGRTKWYCNPYVYSRVFLRLAGQAGGNTMITLENGMQVPAFFGYPIEQVDVMPSKSADDDPSANDVIILFGDLYQASILGSRQETTFAISDQVRFESDETVLRCVRRFDVQHPFPGTNGAAGPVIAFRI